MDKMERLESKTRKFIDGLAAKKGPPLYKMSIDDARGVLSKLQSDPGEMPSALVEDLEIVGGSHPSVSLKIYRPPQAQGKLPAVIYFHGGGWILGSSATHERLMHELANRAQAAIVFVNYSRSPEAKYPMAIEEGYIATKYIAEHGSSLMLDVHKLAVAGDSVGGNMAAVVALLCKDRNGPKLCGQALFYPVTDASMSTASYEEMADGPWLTRAAMQWFWNAYAPDVEERKKPTLSPLNASLQQMKFLPQALVITAENDVLRDEGEAYAHKLQQAGVTVTAFRCLGTIHDFMMLDGIKDTPAAQGALSMAACFLKKFFKH